MDVHVIGAGPSGSIAAITAARAGHTVLLSEEHAVAGIPTHCSGLFSKDGLERLRDYVDYKPLVSNPIYGAILDIAGVRLDINRSEPVAFVCDRAGLDQALAQNAATEGVRIEYGEKITNHFSSNNIIGADGPFSNVARTFGFPKISKYASTVQANIRYACEDPHRVEVYISNENYPGFFAWVIPHNEEQAEFGVGVTRPSALGRAWNHLLRKKGVTRTGKIKGAAIPIRSRAKTAMTNRNYHVLLVGDAAGQTKATTGGGVIFGGQCAMLAGRYANEPWKYELAWRAKHGLDLFAHSLVQGHLEKQTEKQLQAIGRLLKTMKIDSYLSRHGHMDRPTNMLDLNLFSHLLSIPFQ